MDTMRVGEGAKALRVGVKREKREPSTAGSTQARSGASARSRVRQRRGLERGAAAHVGREQPEEVYTKGVFGVGGEATGERKVESACKENGRAEGEGEQEGRIVELVEMVVQGGGET